MPKEYEAEKPHIVTRLFWVFLIIVSFLTGLFKAWLPFGLSLGVLLIALISESYRLLSKKIDQRFDRLEKLIKLGDENQEDEEKE